MYFHIDHFNFGNLDLKLLVIFCIRFPINKSSNSECNFLTFRISFWQFLKQMLVISLFVCAQENVPPEISLLVAALENFIQKQYFDRTQQKNVLESFHSNNK